MSELIVVSAGGVKGGGTKPAAMVRHGDKTANVKPGEIRKGVRIPCEVYRSGPTTVRVHEHDAARHPRRARARRTGQVTRSHVADMVQGGATLVSHSIKPDILHALHGAVHDEYRKRPVTVEAWQITAEDESVLPSVPFSWPAWLEDAWRTETVYADDDGNLHIKTLEGTSYAISPGYWIVRGVRGEMWPVRNDVFEQTYEAVS